MNMLIHLHRLRWPFLVICGCVLGVIEVSFLPFLPSPWHSLHIALSFSALTVILGRSPLSGLMLAFTSGVVIDLFSLSHVTLAVLRFPLIALLAFTLARRFVTHRSLPSLIMLMVAVQILNEAWLRAFDGIARTFFGSGIELAMFEAVLINCIWSGILGSAAFFIWRRFRADFNRISTEAQPEAWI